MENGFWKNMKTMHDEHVKNSKEEDLESLKHWRAWGSWFSWGSPVGLGLALISVGIFLVLLHVATIIK